MACAGGSVVSSKVTVGVKERLESLVDNVKIVRKQIKSNVIIQRAVLIFSVFHIHNTIAGSSSRQYGNSSFSTQHYWTDLSECLIRYIIM